tara:strand:+ start:954 stop:1286 length:333 start_codon:yes stop_codon:yes gene_type:complete
MHFVEITEGTRITAQEVSSWFLNQYIPNHVCNLTVEEKDLSDDGVDGWCIRESDDEYLILIDKYLDDADYLSTLLHELFHVSQHVRGIPRDEDEAYSNESNLLDSWKKNN